MIQHLGQDKKPRQSCLVWFFFQTIWRNLIDLKQFKLINKFQLNLNTLISDQHQLDEVDEVDEVGEVFF